jgi:hypothetical protein
MTIVENHLLTVTGGIDTHLDFHVAAAIDSNGGVLGVETFDTTTGRYRCLVAWLAGLRTTSLIGSREPAPMAPASPATSPTKASVLLRLIAQTAKHDTAPARPTPSTPSQLHELR